MKKTLLGMLLVIAGMGLLAACVESTPEPMPEPRIPANCNDEQFVQQILDLSEDEPTRGRILKVYLGAEEIERTDRVLKCEGEARLRLGGDVSISYYMEIDRDGDGFIGYGTRDLIPTPTPPQNPRRPYTGPTPTLVRAPGGPTATLAAGLPGPTPRPTSTPTPQPTPRPTTWPPLITAERLYAEQEANGTRFDQEYQGQWVTITGLVGEVEGEEVRLVVDREIYRSWGEKLLGKYIALKDLTVEELVQTEKGWEFKATCKVGNYVRRIRHLVECSTTSVPSNPTLAAPAPTPQPITIGTTVEADESAYTVNEVLDPPPVPQWAWPWKGSLFDADTRLVAVDIMQAAIVDGVYASDQFSVLDADGHVYETTFSPFTDVAPSFRPADLDAGQKTRGWVVFEVPKSAALVAVLVREKGSGPSIVIADLTL